MAETKVLTPNNVTEANSTTNGEVQTGMLIFVTPKATTKKKINTIPIAVMFIYSTKWINDNNSTFERKELKKTIPRQL